jgi:hypothetical protein
MFGRLVRWFLVGDSDEPRIDYAKRVELRSAPFPASYLPFVAELAQTAALSSVQRAKLHGDILVFVGEKSFVGVDLELTDRHRVIVATAAALLVLGTDVAQFDHVREIRIFKDNPEPNVGGHYESRRLERGGKVIEHSGVVHLGWPAVIDGLVRNEGQHTAIHELAHAIDHADGKLDALQTHAQFAGWVERLRKLPLHSERRGDFLYTEVIGETEGPELFASASELFFECPRRLHQLEPALFDALVAIYAIDPRMLSDR